MSKKRKPPKSIRSPPAAPPFAEVLPSMERRFKKRRRANTLRYGVVLIAALGCGGALALIGLRPSEKKADSAPATEARPTPSPPPSVAAQPATRSAPSDPASLARVAAVRFVEGAAKAGLSFKHTAGRSARRFAPEIMGPGVTVFDADGDGLDDVLFVNGRPWADEPQAAGKPPTSVFYKNMGGGRFEDRTRASGLGLSAQGFSALAVDLDGDGDRDVIFATLAGTRLYMNDGHGRFKDETPTRGAGVFGWTSVVVPLDVDDDGDLDLFVGRYVDWSRDREEKLTCKPDGLSRDYCSPTLFPATTPVLLVNDGKGHFTDGTERAGLPREAEKVLGALTVDLDGDGRMDLLVANDQVRTQVFLVPGDGTLRESAVPLGFGGTEGGSAYAGMGIDASSQVAGDPGLCIAIGNFYGEPLTVHCRRDREKPFLSKSASLGVRESTLPWVKFGVKWLDADFDGTDDLAVANGNLSNEESIAGIPFRQPIQIFVASGDRMVDASQSALGPLADRRLLGRGMAAIDHDGDGDVDLIVTENDGAALLLVNESKKSGHSIDLRLLGLPPNTDALGAVIEVAAGAKTYRTWVHATGSYAAQSMLDRVIGLGAFAGPVDVTVRWPDGRVQIEKGLSVDRRQVIAEDAKLVAVARPAGAKTEETARIRAMAALRRGDEKGALPLLEQAVAESPYEPELARELASGYAATGDERKALDWAAQAAERAKDPDVVVRQLVGEFLRRKQPRLALAAAERAVASEPSPSSALWGNLGSLRQGAGQAQAAESAFKKALDLLPTNATAATNLGRLLNQGGRPTDTLALLLPFEQVRGKDAAMRRVLGEAYHALGKPEAARREFAAAVAADPTDGMAEYNLGEIALGAQQFYEAVQHLRRASELSQDDFRVWGNLGIALRGMGRKEEARAAFERVLRMRPDDPLAKRAVEELR